MARDKFQTQLHIKADLKERSVRVACLIAEILRNALDLLEEQPPGVIEAMLEGLQGGRADGRIAKAESRLAG
jgi:hypothetical protein